MDTGKDNYPNRLEIPFIARGRTRMYFRIERLAGTKIISITAAVKSTNPRNLHIKSIILKEKEFI